MRCLALGLGLSLAVACTRREQAIPTRDSASAHPAARDAASPTPASAAPDAGAARGARELPFIHDDFRGALAAARAANKALFVDAWAAWCHTCLSMQHYVLNQPALLPLAERVVFLAIDTEREQNAAFLERYEVNVWPTFFIIEPASERVVGLWPGSGSVAEMRSFIEHALASIDALAAGTLAPDAPLGLLLTAKAAQAQAQYARAAELYARVVSGAPADFPRRDEAIAGWVESLFRLGRAAPCVEVGLRHLRDVKGAARPVDYTYQVLECTKGLPAGQRARPRKLLIDRLRELAEAPPKESSPDDHADALQRLAEALRADGDGNGARAAHEQRLSVLERAAASAPSPEAAATYDYGRASAYLSLGRPEDAIRMLEERQKQLPSSYEPPARLASVLAELKRWPEARVAVERALEHAYGPRRLRYLALKARIQQQQGDRAGAVATLEEELRGHRELKRGANDPSLKDAQKRLAEARGR